MKRRRMIQHTFLPSMPSIFVPLLGFTTDMFLVQYQHFHPYQSFFRCLVRRYIDRKRLLLASFVDKASNVFFISIRYDIQSFLVWCSKYITSSIIILPSNYQPSLSVHISDARLSTVSHNHQVVVRTFISQQYCCGGNDIF